MKSAVTKLKTHRSPGGMLMEESSGNVFADLGLKSPEEHLLKVKLSLPELTLRLKQGQYGSLIKRAGDSLIAQSLHGSGCDRIILEGYSSLQEHQNNQTLYSPSRDLIVPVMFYPVRVTFRKGGGKYQVLAFKAHGQIDFLNIDHVLFNNEKTKVLSSRTPPPDMSRAISDYTQELGELLEATIDLIHENTDWGASAKKLAQEYNRNEDTMRHHMKTANHEGIIRYADSVCHDEIEKFRSFMARPGKMRSRRETRP